MLQYLNTYTPHRQDRYAHPSLFLTSLTFHPLCAKFYYHMSDYPQEYAIARIDLPDSCTFGWQVRLQRRGIKYAKFFSDNNFGSKQDSLNASKYWRNQLLDRFQEEDHARICTRSTRNSSGVVGVSKVTVVASNGVNYNFWQATWSPEPGKRRCVKFSIKRYGDTEAFERAVRARLDAIGG